MSELVEAALAWHDAGFCVLPAASDGSKRVGLSSWQQYQSQRPEREEVAAWAASNEGIGLVMGRTSGNAEMIEIEGKAAHLSGEFVKVISESAPELAAKLLSGYIEVTPSGGWHWIYRVDGEVAGNTKLAQRPAEPGPGRDTLLETRGEGGWVVVAPSGGRVHPTGQPWARAAGCYGVVATLTTDERDTLHRIARTFDLMPAEEPTSYGPARERQPGDPASPGDDFNERATWEEILAPHGWQVHHRDGEETYWTRPGKDRRHGWSARTGRGPYLWVYSSSTEFVPERSHRKFFVYAVLNHGGDTSAAAKRLRELHYGDDRPPANTAQAQAESRATLQLIQGGQAPTTSGANALSPEAASSPVSPLRQTELGNARRFAEIESPRMRYVPQRNAWVAWRETRWEWQPTKGESCPLAVQAMVDLIETMKPADEHELKWMVRSASERSIKAAIRLAAADPRVVMALDRFDAVPHELNTQSGLVDMRDATVRTPTPEDMHTRLTGVGVDFEAGCPRWLRFLADTFDGDQEMIDFLQRLAGYAATGEVTHHVLPFLHGNGANGKSVFLDVLMRILGEYAAPAQSDLLLSSQIHESFIAMMSGVRLLVANEVGPTARFNEQRVKQFTGGDLITSRKLNQEPFTFKPTHTLVMAGNHQPRVDSGGESIWRRLRLVGFNRTVPVAERIVGLADQLIEEEGPAILAWVVRGAMAQYVDGLKEPESVLAATKAYEQSEDHLGRFLEERVRFGGGADVMIVKGDLYDAYKGWCHEEGEVDSMLPGNTFGRELKARGVGEKKSNSRRFYTNVTLMAPERESAERDAPRQLIYGD